MSSAAAPVEKCVLQGTELPSVLCMTWSFDGSILAVGTTEGFLVYAVGSGGSSGHARAVEFKEPSSNQSGETVGATTSTAGARSGANEHRSTFQEVSRRHFQGGVAHISIMEHSNVILFSGASEQHRNIVMLWDDTRAPADQQSGAAKMCIVAQLSLDSSIRGLRLSKYCIVVAEPHFTHVFDHSLTLLESFPTPNAFSGSAGKEQELKGGGDNRANTIALASKPVQSRALAGSISPSAAKRGSPPPATGDKRPVTDNVDWVLRMVILGPSTGSVRCLELPVGRNGAPSSSGVGGGEGGKKLHSKMAHPQPHERPVNAIGISVDGTTAITVSERGTALKVIDVSTGAVLRQLNRGTTSRLVQSIALNNNASVAIAVSDAGTVHCYNLNAGGGGGGAGAMTTPSKSVGGAIKGAFNAGVGLIPNAVAKSKYVQPLTSYTSAENAVATFRLSTDDCSTDEAQIQKSAPPLEADIMESNSGASGTGGTGELLYEADGFGTAAQTQPQSLDSDFVCVALRPGIRRGCEATMLIAQGSLAPSSLRIKSRCMRVKIDMEGKECTKEATYLFPKEEL